MADTCCIFLCNEGVRAHGSGGFRYPNTQPKPGGTEECLPPLFYLYPCALWDWEGEVGLFLEPPDLEEINLWLIAAEGLIY